MGMEVLAVTTDTAATRRQLGLLSVVVLTFLSVCGGPFGSEEIVSACGPLIGLTALIVFPIVYSLPMNLLLAELCSAFPVDSSFCTWVGIAFGRSWGFYVGYWSWMASTFDAAVYPCLVVDALYLNTTDVDGSGWATKTGVRVLILTLFMVPTLFSLKFIGRASTWLTAVVLLPFGVLVLVAVPQMQWTNLVAVGPSMRWSQLVSVLFWNFRGFDAMGAYAGEIESPQTNMSRAMVASLLLISATYMLPLVAAVGVNEPVYSTWTDGSFPAIAGAIGGGTWLAQWVAVANTVSSFGLYFAESSANGFRLAGMADVGLAPRWFATRDEKTGSPRRAILFIYAISVGMCCVDFTTILGVTNALSIMAQLVQCAAALTLRYTHADLSRPYRVNLSNSALSAVMVVPVALAVAVFVTQVLLNAITLGLTAVAVAVGVGMRQVLGHAQDNDDYDPIPDKKAGNDRATW